ncbi:uncharacterized protein EDB93DRAFT_890711 [Suillus bovinus]|uniref:uncharacterized protein n=1 Tax=Suillus bovinus TaxID=48563 RepID=UPI001B8697AE|nr:uncharacterized protein EDB93DRAFT_890711 [Suillus bovinus]KAG2132902.1 hypothetical protein EDB93DRAFT_890711 [Suillus bovinus]
MEYSAVDISLATSLQRLVYLYMSMTTLWTYDYACSLHEEWTFLRRSRLTKVKALYIVTRYLPFFLITMYLCRTLMSSRTIFSITYRRVLFSVNFTPNRTSNKCQILIDIYSSLSQISLTCSECFFMLRTYALWNNNKIVLVIMLSTAFAMVVTSISIRFIIISTSYVTTSGIPGIPGCSGSSSGVLYYMSFIFLFVFQLGLFSLTLIRAVQSWRSANGPLQAVLVKHNMYYYACGLFLSATNVLVPALFPNSPYYTALENFQVYILAILGTRMHLHLWHFDQHMHNSDALVYISMSDMSPADLIL